MKFYLNIKWKYKYDKEGYWIDEYNGVNKYDLVRGASYELPRFTSKSLFIISVNTYDDVVSAELSVDGANVTVIKGAEPVSCHVYDEYGVCGDSVSRDLYMTISIEQE